MLTKNSFMTLLVAATLSFGFAVTSQAADKKMSYKDAKADCLKTDATLKGKALRKCIHEKRAASAPKGN